MQVFIKRLTLPVLIIAVIVTGSLSRNNLTAGARSSLTPAVYIPLVLRGETQVLPPPPTPTPTPDPDQPGWVLYLNDLRNLGDLPPITENLDWSNGCWDHARYMVKNDTITHYQDPSNPWYTPDGSQAALASNLIISSAFEAPDDYAIQHWLTGPFHGVSILDPRLVSTGYGSYRENTGTWQMGACFDVLRGRSEVPAGVQFPIYWPGEASEMPFLEYTGGEYPDPLSPCPGYTTPTGPALYLLLGSGELTPHVTTHSFAREGVALEHCAYDETSYTHPDPNAQYLGRSILGGRDAIILIPRDPLEPGATYTASILADGYTHTWTFTANSSPAATLMPAFIEPAAIIQ
jgi:hypothetical protein